MLEDAFPDALLDPAIEAFPDRVPGSEAFGQVAPGRAGLGDPQDGIDEEAVVVGGDAWESGPAGQKILDAVPVFVRDGVAVAHDSLRCS